MDNMHVSKVFTPFTSDLIQDGSSAGASDAATSDLDRVISYGIARRIGKDEALSSVPGSTDMRRRSKVYVASLIRKLPGAKRSFKKTLSPLNEATTFNAMLSALERSDHHGTSYHRESNRADYSQRREPPSPIEIPESVHGSAYVKVRESDKAHGKMDKGILKRQYNEYVRRSDSLKNLSQLNSTVGVWSSYKVDGHEVSENAVDPTSERTGNPALDHLHNININFHKADRHLTITCGIIDTRQKADELFNLVQSLKEKGQFTGSVRVALHQLNSFGLKIKGDRRLIQMQRIASSYLDDRFRNEGIVGDGYPAVFHSNTAVNGMTRIAKELHNEVELCDEFNGEAGAAYLALVHQRFPEDESAQGIKDMLATYRELQSTRASVFYDEDSNRILDHMRVESSPRAIGELTKDLKKAEKSAKIRVKDSVKELERVLSKQASALSRAIFSGISEEISDERSQVLTLLSKVLSPEKGSSQGLRVMNMYLLDRMLGVASEFNCKSGLDRTGYIRSLVASLSKLQEERGYSAAINFVQNSDRLMEEVSILQENWGSHKVFARSLENQPILILRDAYEFQRDFLNEILSVAKPITQRSTGLEGLKWHWQKNGMNPLEKNMHPIPYIPKYVSLPNGEEVSLTRYSGGKKVFTTYSTELLVGQSGNRGA
ncbi:MAG: hypothetical protein ACI9S8_002134 [Chlamydiales bacterium]|jgi:hypothetical protein